VITFVVGPQRSRDGKTHYRTVWNGKPYEVVTDRAGTAMLCRLLVTDGAPDEPWQAVDHATGAVRFNGPSIHSWAGKVIREYDSKRGLQVEKWRPFDKGSMTS
jgi:hypothetical protein